MGDRVGGKEKCTRNPDSSKIIIIIIIKKKKLHKEKDKDMKNDMNSGNSPPGNNYVFLISWKVFFVVNIN